MLTSSARNVQTQKSPQYRNKVTAVPASRCRGRLLLLPVVGLSAVAVPAVVGAGPSAALTTPARATPSTAPRAVLTASPAAGVSFASPTVVDDYRPGFEPDIAVDTGLSSLGKRVYTSTPFGFSTTQSFIERSNDGAASFHNIAGQVAGKPTTCVGGGDTELQIDQTNGHLFFVDLQGLTEYSTARSDNFGASFTFSCAAVSGSGVDRQWVALDTNGGTSPVTPAAADGKAYLIYDNVAQSTSPTTMAGNQLVINQSGDGVQYGSVCAPGVGVTTPDGVCAAPATVISPDEGLPGNLIVDNTPGGTYQHSVYAVHTSSALDHMVVSICRPPAAGATTLTATAAANYCSDPTAAANVTNNTGRVSTHWQDVTIDPSFTGVVDKAFPVIAVDRTGGLYATWASAPTSANGQTAPAQIYLSSSGDGGLTWSTPVKINNPTDQVTNIFPWITAGDKGRVDVAWYASHDSTGSVPYDSDSLSTGHWDVFLAQSTTAATLAPAFSISKVSDHFVKYGSISTGGLGGAADRSLGDYLQVTHGSQGEALVSYVDDTSQGRNADSTGTGQTVSEAAGPTVIAKQIAGPSLFAGTADLGPATAAVGSVTAPVGDAYLAAAGQTVPGSPAEDITGVKVTQPDDTHLQLTMSTNDPQLASDLAAPTTVSALAGSTTGVWQVRWADRYEPALLDGAIRYVGMQSTAGGAPSFYTGSTTCIATTRCKFLSYPATTPVPGSISGNTITWTVPLSAIGSPPVGAGLWSITGSTAVQPAPSTPGSATTLPTSGDPMNSQIPQRLDAAPSFSYIIAQAASPPPAVSETPMGPLLIGGTAVVLVLLVGGFGIRRQRTA